MEESKKAPVESCVESQSTQIPSGRTPVLIQGCGNHITIIERQYNDRTASETVNALLESEKDSGATAKMIIENVSKLIPMIMDKTVKPAPQPAPVPVKRAPAKKAAVKKAPVKKAAPSKPAKKARIASGKKTNRSKK